MLDGCELAGHKITVSEIDPYCFHENMKLDL